MEGEISKLVDGYESGGMTRRQLVAGLGSLVAVLSGAGKLLGASSEEDEEKGEDQKKEASTFQATELNHIALRVTDVKRSRDFYIKHLGLKVSRESDSNCFLNFGDNFLALFRGDEAQMDHYCYSIKSYDVNEAEKKLTALGLKPRVTSGRIYFQDPDGLTVQLAATAHQP